MWATGIHGLVGSVRHINPTIDPKLQESWHHGDPNNFQYTRVLITDIASTAGRRCDKFHRFSRETVVRPHILWNDLLSISSISFVECGYDFCFSLAADNSSPTSLVTILLEMWTATEIFTVGGNAFYEVFPLYMWHRRPRDNRCPIHSTPRVILLELR